MTANAMTASKGMSVALAAALGGIKDSGASLHSFLKFSGKDGKVTFRDGDDEVELHKDARLALSVAGSQKGYVCWQDGGVIDEYMVLMTEELPPIEEMTDHGTSRNPEDNEGWRFQFSIPLKDMETGKQFVLKLPSESGRREFGKFLKKFGEASGLHDLDAEIPLVTITAKQFLVKGTKHKPYKPVFEIVDWIDEDEADFTPLEAPTPMIANHSEESNESADNSTDDVQLTMTRNKD
jgi:hypothetical protein